MLLTVCSCNQQTGTTTGTINSSETNQNMSLTTIYWKDFQIQHPEYKAVSEPPSFYFCDNKKDADECAELVIKKIKQATSPSVWWFKKNQEAFPKAGDLAIVTNWNGEPKAIIRTKKTEFVAYKNITADYAFIEGEGDRSLDYWKRTHWEYYTKEMKKIDESPTEDMEIVCEHFETIWVK